MAEACVESILIAIRNGFMTLRQPQPVIINSFA